MSSAQYLGLPAGAGSILLSLDVIERLERDVVACFRAVTRPGSEIGGILLGRAAGDTLVIDDYELVRCEYTRGALYWLSADEKRRLAQAVAGPRAPSALSAVGLFRSNARKELALDGEDLEVIREFFAGPRNVCLLIKPFALKPAAAAFFAWPGGQVGPASSEPPFPCNRAALTSAFAERLLDAQAGAEEPEPLAAEPEVAEPAGPPAAAIGQRPGSPVVERFHTSPVMVEEREPPAEPEPAEAVGPPSAGIEEQYAAALRPARDVLPGVQAVIEEQPATRVEPSSMPASATAGLAPRTLRWRWILIFTVLVLLLAYAAPRFLWSPPDRGIDAGSAAGPAPPPTVPASGAASPAPVRPRAAVDPPPLAVKTPEEPARARPVPPTPAPKPFPVAAQSLKTAAPAPKVVVLPPPEQPVPSVTAGMPQSLALGSHFGATAPPPVTPAPIPQAKTVVEPVAPSAATGGISTVRAPRVLRRVPPTYPPLAKQARVAGTVRLVVVIGSDGRMKEVASVTGPFPLRRAAIDAVKLWLFEPALLNGQAVEFRHAVDVVFTLR